MTIWSVQEAFVPQRVRIPMIGMDRDWHGAAFSPAAEIALVADSDFLWLLARRLSPARPDPKGKPGELREGLWQHDVAELFIATPDRERYLEFNLSPSGAWWFAGFYAPRVRVAEHALPQVRALAFPHAEAGWSAALGIPLDFLKQHIAWGPDSTINVTLILNSPDQQFLSVADLGAGDPDFHRPQHFAGIEWRDLPDRGVLGTPDSLGNSKDESFDSR